MTRPRPALLYGALVLQTCLSAGTYLLAKRALVEIPPLPLGLLRFAGASVCLAGLLAWLLPRGARLPPQGERKKLWALAFVAVPLNQGFFLVGLSLSTPAHAALLYSLTPLMVLLLAQAIHREFPGARSAAGTALALGGTLLVLFHRGVDLSRGPLLGDLLLIGAVLAWAVYTALGRPLVARHGAMPTTAWSLIGGTALYLPIGLATLLVPANRAQMAQASPAAWSGILYMALAASVVAYLLWYWALKHLAAAQVAVFSNLQPLATAVLGWLIVGDAVTWEFVAGALVVMAGVVLAQSGRRVTSPVPDAPPEP